MMNRYSYMLDAVADSLEAKGQMKEAYAIDKISNALEKLSWDINEKPLIVKVKPNSTIQADSLILVGQLKRDISEALNYIGESANAAYTNYYHQETNKTKELVSKLRSELEKSKVDIWSKSLFNGMDVDDWKPGDYYDISEIYNIGKEIRSHSRGYGSHSIKGLKLLDLIAETYPKAEI